MTESFAKRSRPFKFLVKHLIQRSFVPSARMVRFAALGTPLLIADVVLGFGWYLFVLYNGLLLTFALLDMLLFPNATRWRFSRNMPEREDVRRSFEVELVLELEGSDRRWEVRFMDDLPQSFETASMPAGRLREDRFSGVYRTQALERGAYRLAFSDVRIRGALGLLDRQLRFEHASEIRVYPDLSGVRGVLGSDQPAMLLEGQRILRRASGGMDFDAIREYVPGDEPRHINWRSTARTGTPMLNTYRPEKGKTITLLIDCGRMMGVDVDGVVKLDRSLATALTIAAVAIKQGDYVSVLAFGSDVLLSIPPDKGMGHLQAIIEAVFDLRPQFAESNYRAAFERLGRSRQKRSLAILLSDMENYVADDSLVPGMEWIKKKHAVLLLSLQDPVLRSWTETAVEDVRTAWIKSSAYRFDLDRSGFIRDMASRGIRVVDAPAEELAVAAVNAYLEMKARNAL